MSLESATKYGLNARLHNDRGVPISRYGDELLAPNGNGDTYGETSIDFEGTEADLELMSMSAEVAQLLEQNQAEKIVPELERYLSEVRVAENELIEQHPSFSSVLDQWADNELQERNNSQSSSGEKSLEADETKNVALARIYEELREEISEDYQEAIDNNDIQAQAELDVINRLINEKAAEHTLLDMIEYYKDKSAYAKAA